MDAKSTVCVIDGDVFYSPNCARNFTLPAAGEDRNLYQDLKTGSSTSESLQHPRWWTPQTEWLAFVPRSPVLFSGGLLEALAFIPRRMISHDGQRFAMPQYLINEWLAIDELLAKITRELTSKHQLGQWWPRSPYHFQYHKTHATQQAAREQAALARDWFGLWIGLLFWMTRKIPDPSYIEGITPPIWFLRAIQLGFKQAVWDGLRTAPLLNRHWITERVGVILPYPENPSQPSVSWFISSGVPVWYRWGPRETAGLARDPNFPLQPPPEWQLQEATTWFTRRPSSFATAFVEPSRYTPLPPPSFEPFAEPTFFSPASPPPEVPEEGIPQPNKALEVLTKFFREREAVNARRRERETDVDRQRRMGREKNPPTTSAPVYVWDWDFNTPSIFKRTLIRKADRESTLQNFGHQQKRYDPFFNEWNCSDELGPEGPEAGDEEDDNWRAQVGNPAEPLPQPELATTVNSGVESQIFEAIRLYYGFVPPLPLPDQVPGECKSAERLHTAVLAGIAEAQEDLALFKQPVVRLCARFLRHFWQTPLVKPPVESWDLFSSNRLCVATSLRIHTIQVVTSKKGERLYMFNFGSLSTVPWKLAVHSASVALLICRLPNTLVDERDIATYLLDHGIKFRTLRLSSDLQSATQEQHEPVSARFRFATDQFSRADYDCYTQDVAAFLRQRHGRAALLAGGLLWRIAKEMLSFSDVLEGPLSRYSGGQIMFTATDASGNEYVDDELTEHETDFLCGLYVKFTGIGADQKSKASWFPLVGTWEAGALSQAFWTNRNEEWYSKRLASIDKGGAPGKPLGAKNWRDEVKGYKDIKKIVVQHEAWSREELSGYISKVQ